VSSAVCKTGRCLANNLPANKKNSRVCSLLNFQVIVVSVCDGVSGHIQCLNLVCVCVCVYVCLEAEGRLVALECVSLAGSANGVSFEQTVPPAELLQTH